MENIDLTFASSFSGVVYKKSPRFLVGYQKRWFHILDGKLLTYAEKQGGQAKGALRIELITGLAPQADNKW
jgi:hypothetical protein